MKRICFFLSDHGFGHIARNIPIIVSVVKNYDTFVYVVCGERHIEFAKKNLELMLTAEQYKRVSFHVDHTDIGLICKDGTLDVDSDALTKSTTEFLSELPQKAEQYFHWLTENHIDAVLCDMPIWSIQACELADVPLLYVGNFTWAEMYREHLPSVIWQSYSVYYGKIKHAMLYALHNNEMLEFLKSSEKTKTSVTARPFDEKAVSEIRAKHNRPIVFVALGMSAQFKEPLYVSSVPYDFYTTEGVPLVSENVEVIPYTTINTQDYVAAADYVITKAGWGTVSECLLAKKPMALFARDSVLEDRTTIRLLEEKHLAVSVTQDDLHDIEEIVNRLDRLDGSYGELYDCADEIAAKLMSI
ncbi:MAG: glycosyltransferase family protein [Ruminococcus sp.]|nr:glycosyltransferase family protein [Ruminococcus sp.]